MRIVGEWLRCDDGLTRPVVHARVPGRDGSFHPERFLVDTAADRTVFSGDLLRKLQLPPDPPPAAESLVGIGGQSAHVLVTTLVEFTRDDGGPARVRGQFAAFTDPRATDLSILGRDVLDIFDVICSRRRNQVLLLAPNHEYQVIPP